MKSAGITPITGMSSINAMLKSSTMNSLIISTFTKETEYLFMAILMKNSLRNNKNQRLILSKGFINIKMITSKRVWKFEEMITSR